MMTKVMNSFLVLGLICFSAFAEESKPKYVSTTVRLSQSRDFVKKNAAPDFWAFMPYYVPQQDGAACGVASMTMLANAARSHDALTASDTLITQKALVEKIKVDYVGKGLSLDQLADNIHKAMKEYSKGFHQAVYHVDGTPAQTKKIREILIKNEKSDRNFIIANFLQAAYTGDPEGPGHISPVGAFDEKNNKVLIFDVDREYYEPYWVSFDTFIKGMNTADSTSKINRGFVFVELE